MTDSPTAALSREGVSIWLDDLSRLLISSGDLEKLIQDRNVVGVTTNPTIFAAALSKAHAYEEQLGQLADAGAAPVDAIFDLTTEDVRRAADLLAPVYEASGGFDGRVSLEVEPRLAYDTAGTTAEAEKLWAAIDRPNAMVKIPATDEGLAAITEAIAAGISINVTLIFSLERYRKVIDAYLAGLERAQLAGIGLSTIHSVASFFVSRVDAEIDKRLDLIGSEEATVLKGKAGIANARLAYEIYEEAFTSERAKRLLDAGANAQRPLWASTGVKDPALPDTAYVVELVANGVVNTMPHKTLDAVHDHGQFRGDTVTGAYTDAHKTLEALEALGISYQEVTAQLEQEGVQKFNASWDELVETVTTALDHSRTAQANA
ncbi:transaldolase [Paenarthrobacter sp. YJN-5]|uniref:transaldolase n=1 Tax=Paenarthrobacter sp. YJN-5 TaxID=2735316 RepID=UPI00187826FA|nr:transaldolase [Paenarthrobacter sp. YJN-5]QOT15250.1 transaldolase [Paenarthrobacter sp. YJN-5]